MAIIHHISIKNLRNILTFSISFTSPIVIISGNNGSGKTTFLEAIYFLCHEQNLFVHHILHHSSRIKKVYRYSIFFSNYREVHHRKRISL